MTFDRWWNFHKRDTCICPGTCLWRILEVQEGWADDKARKRLLGFLKISENDEMPEEYIDGRKYQQPADVHGEGQDQKESFTVSADSRED